MMKSKLAPGLGRGTPRSCFFISCTSTKDVMFLVVSACVCVISLFVNTLTQKVLDEF